MAFWTDKEGNKLSLKEFMAKWKEGINRVTPIQQIQSQVIFTFITLIGLLCGIVVTIFNFSSLWWLCIILVAAFGNTTVGLIGLNQKLILLKQIEEMKGGSDEQERTDV